MKVTCLGTGSPEPDPHRASAGYLVEVADARILLDCGGGVFDRLVQAGRAPRDITHIIFSHLHSDHMLDYARLVHAAWDMGGAPLQVFGPAPIAAITRKLFGADGVFAHDLTARTEHPASQAVWQARGGELPRPWPAPRVHEVPARASDLARPVCAGDGWQARACVVPHVQPYLDCLALRVESGDAAVVYSGDAGLCRALQALCADADLLLHWCYRLDGEETGDESDAPLFTRLSPGPRAIARMASRARVKHLLLTHLRPATDTAAGRAAALAMVREEFTGAAGIACDLMQIELPASPAPTP